MERSSTAPPCVAETQRRLSRSVSGQSGQPNFPEPSWVAFAFLRGINDAPGDDLINDFRLS